MMLTIGSTGSHGKREQEYNFNFSRSLIIVWQTG